MRGPPARSTRRLNRRVMASGCSGRPSGWGTADRRIVAGARSACSRSSRSRWACSAAVVRRSREMQRQLAVVFPSESCARPATTIRVGSISSVGLSTRPIPGTRGRERSVLLPSERTPISTSRHSLSSPRRTLTWMPSAQAVHVVHARQIAAGERELLVLPLLPQPARPFQRARLRAEPAPRALCDHRRPAHARSDPARLRRAGSLPLNEQRIIDDSRVPNTRGLATVPSGVFKDCVSGVVAGDAADCAASSGAAAADE